MINSMVSSPFLNCKTKPYQAQTRPRSIPSNSASPLLKGNNTRCCMTGKKIMASAPVSPSEREAPFLSKPSRVNTKLEVTDGKVSANRAPELVNTNTEITDSKVSANGALDLLESFLSFFSTSVVSFIHPPLHPSVDPNHVLAGNFAPVSELPPTDCVVVEGELPKSLNGTYIRNGTNPHHQPKGPHHFFEGDGMLHSIRFSDGQATFCSRYVKTYKYAVEDNVGFPIFPNVLTGFYSLVDLGRCAVAIGRVIKGQIDPMKGFGVANTSLAFFSNRLFALAEYDLPYSIRLTKEGDIATIERCDFAGQAFLNMSAHPKVDVETGETFAFRCSPVPPYITFFRIEMNGHKQQDVPIFSMKGPTFVHDFSVTKQYIVLSESQLEMKPLKLMICKGMPVSTELDKVPRIGVLPRYSLTESEIMWFDAPGFNAMHVINAWEEGEDEIILVAPNAISLENLFHNIEMVHFSLEKVRINLRNGSILRTTISKKNLELGSINPSYLGKKNRYAYMGIGEIVPKMSGVVKIDLELECEVSRRMYGAGCFGGEPLFVAKDGATEKDDGYLVAYVHDENSGMSRFVMMDTKSPTLDVVAVVKLPGRVPYGFHGLFVRESDVQNTD